MNTIIATAAIIRKIDQNPDNYNALEKII